MAKTTFDEQSILTLFENIILDGFASDFEIDWTSAFGGKQMVVCNYTYGTQTYFPCFHIEIENPVKYLATSDSSQNERFTTFEFEIQMFNQATTEYDARTLGIMINRKTKLLLQDSLDLQILSNSQVPNADQTIYRRIITGEAVYDNIYRTFYHK